MRTTPALVSSITAAALALAAPTLATAAPLERRLHSASLEASSFLWNDWNKYQENYHPNYVADDDAKTAWVEGAGSSGAGEWLRVNVTPLDKTTQVRLKIRNGYQKSKALFTANARAKEVTVKLLPSNTTHKATLTDKDGWQELTITQPSGPVRAVELDVGSVYEGSKYADLCISDIQVFATSETADNPAFEKSKRKELLAWRAARIAAAKTFAKAKVELPLRTSYQVTPTDWPSACDNCDLASMIDAALVNKGFAEWKDALAFAKETAEGLDSLPRGQLAPKTKQAIPAVDGIATTSMYEVSDRYYSENGLHMPLLDSVSVLFADQLRILDVKGKLTPTELAAVNKCPKGGTQAWVKRTAAKEKTAPDVVRAVVLGECQLLEGREGSYTAAGIQLLVYDADGRLALVVGDGQIDGIRWAVADGKPMITGGRSLLSQGTALEVTERK
jgi:hypothetical protein